MKVLVLSCAVAASAVIVAAPATAGDIVWDESVQGDISSDHLAPTPVTFTLGSNIIIGSMAAPDDPRDYITFTIPQGMALGSLLLLRYEDLNTGGMGNIGFHGIIEGPTSLIPDGANIHLFLGAAHLDWQPPGTDILPFLANGGLGAQGFTPPLGPGTYTYHAQQTDTDLTGYTLNFVMIPAPGAALALLPLALCCAPRRRR